MTAPQVYDEAYIQDKTFMVHLADSAGDRAQAINYLEELLEAQTSQITLDQRNLISKILKGHVETDRNTIQLMDFLLQQSNLGKFGYYMGVFHDKIIDQLKEKCQKAIKIIENSCLDLSKSSENMAFFLLLLGDFERYLSDIYQIPHNLIEDVVEIPQQMRDQWTFKVRRNHKARNHYENALKIALKDLSRINPIRLAIFLNFSVITYELEEKELAIQMTETALQGALGFLDDQDLSEEAIETTYKDSLQIVGKLKKNHALWTSEKIDLAKAVEDEKPSETVIIGADLITPTPHTLTNKRSSLCTTPGLL